MSSVERSGPGAAAGGPGAADGWQSKSGDTLADSGHRGASLGADGGEAEASGEVVPGREAAGRTGSAAAADGVARAGGGSAGSETGVSLKPAQTPGGSGQPDIDRRAEPEPGMMKSSRVPSKLEIAKVIVMMLMFFSFLSICWSVAYIGAGLVFQHRPEREAWQRLDAAVATFRDGKPATWEEAGRLFAVLAHNPNERFVLDDGSGPPLVSGGAEVAAAAGPLHQDVMRVLNGGKVRETNRSYWVGRGVVVSGTRVVIGGQAYALFAMTETAPLWYGLDVQLIASFVGMVLVFVITSLLAPHRKRMEFFIMLNDAMRKMAKGDFNIALPDSRHMGDDIGGLVQGFNQMAVELGQMEKMRQEFISNVSHEIQSPLTSIRGFSRALMNESLDVQERRQYLGIIEAESERLSKISDNLLKLSSLESAQPPFERQRYRLDKQLRNLVLACEPQWVDKELELDVQLEEGAIAGDQDLLSQVWTNLLHNSIKFTPQGGTLGVRLTFADGWAQVHIRDTGIGISEADQARIFERFYKADTARSSSGGGSGLGLSIVCKIVELHGGTVGVESRLGEGSTFTVKLPVEPPPAAETGTGSEAGTEGA